jgi:hypothetical protein
LILHQRFHVSRLLVSTDLFRFLFVLFTAIPKGAFFFFLFSFGKCFHGKGEKGVTLKAAYHVAVCHSLFQAIRCGETARVFHPFQRPEHRPAIL